MRNIMTYLRVSALIVGAWIVTAADLSAAQESTVLVPSASGTTVKPAMPAPGQAATQPRQQIVIDESVSAPHSEMLPGGAAVIRNPSCIKYDTDRSARRMYACSGSVNVIMVACNPANGCLYEIPLCIPGCCVGEATVSSRCGLFGRGIVEYCWPCGFSAEVKFRNIGDIKVDYDG